MNISVPEAFCAITGATALGVVTVSAADCLLLFPGARAWLCKDDGSARARVKILSRLSATTIKVRRYKNDDENATPQYGTSDMSAFNATSHISQEIQTAPVDDQYNVRTIP